MSFHHLRGPAVLGIVLVMPVAVLAWDAPTPARAAEMIPALELTPAEVEAARARLEAATANATGLESRAIWLVDDFEDGLDPGWTDIPGGGTTSIDIIGADGTSHSLRIDGGQGSYSGLVYDLGGWQPTGITVWVRSSSTADDDAYVVLGDDDTTANSGAIFFYAQGNGHLTVVTNGLSYSCNTYSADTWYRIGFVVDWACQVFDVYVDGVLRQYNLPFRNPVASFTELHVLNFDLSSTAWWDQITMSTPPVSFLIFSDDFERGSTCHWSAVVN